MREKEAAIEQDVNVVLHKCETSTVQTSGSASTSQYRRKLQGSAQEIKL
jgi:hypothetical protein